jgi:predicted nucleic acid-binding protein
VVIVDSTVWIDYLRGSHNSATDWLDRHLQRQRLGLTDLILCEVLQGTRGSDFRRVRADLLKFEIYECCGTELAIAAAENYRILRRMGYTLRTTIDCLIATFCIYNGHSLLHRDRDFDAFENALGLSVIHC